MFIADDYWENREREKRPALSMYRSPSQNNDLSTSLFQFGDIKQSTFRFVIMMIRRMRLQRNRYYLARLELETMAIAWFFFSGKLMSRTVWRLISFLSRPFFPTVINQEAPPNAVMVPRRTLIQDNPFTTLYCRVVGMHIYIYQACFSSFLSVEYR